MSLYIANTYAELIHKGFKTIEDVPSEERVPGLVAQVEQILKEKYLQDEAPVEQ